MTDTPFASSTQTGDECRHTAGTAAHLQGCATSGLYPHGSLKGSLYSVLCAAALLADAPTAPPPLLVKLSATVPEPEADQAFIGFVMPNTSLLTMPYAMTRRMVPGMTLLIGLQASRTVHVRMTKVIGETDATADQDGSVHSLSVLSLVSAGVDGWVG